MTATTANPGSATELATLVHGEFDTLCLATGQQEENEPKSLFRRSFREPSNNMHYHLTMTF